MYTTLLKRGDSYFCVLSRQRFPEKVDQLLMKFLACEQWIDGDRIDQSSLLVCGPRLATTSPWSTNMIQILHAIGHDDFLSLLRIEKFVTVEDPNTHHYDEMTEEIIGLENLLQQFDTLITPNNNKVQHDTARSKEYLKSLNTNLGLALSDEEMDYLVDLFGKKYKRSATLSEISIFAQLNSEHCRHKLFNGHFVIDGQKQIKTPFAHIKETYKQHPGEVLIAYKDNGSVIKGKNDIHPTFKAETHNHPSLIEPFNGGATGLGGCLRDAMAIGSGSEVDASTSAYFVGNIYKKAPYKAHTALPRDILIKASAGVHAYGNTNATPLINGSVIAPSSDMKDAQGKTKAFAKPVILAGALGRIHTDNLVKKANVGDLIVKLGGPDYRIGIFGAAASSLNSGENTGTLDFASVQRADPQMQIKVKKVIEVLSREYPKVITVIHDYGAGGHGNCFFEILEDMGGEIDIARISLGDPSLSYHEILINESQERMGLLIDPQYKKIFTDICARESCPFDIVGTVNQSGKIRVFDSRTGEDIVDVCLNDFLFSQHNEYRDQSFVCHEARLGKNVSEDVDYMKLLAEPTIGSKGFLVYHVDRSVNGKVVQSATCGRYQLPLSDYGLLKIDALKKEGTLTSQGSRPFLTLIDPEAMVAFSLAEVVLNASFVVSRGLETISLSGNWMWPAKKEYQKTTLYQAVEAVSRFAQELKINIPVGKDSVSMSVEDIDAPGALLLSLLAFVEDTSQRVTPELKKKGGTKLVYIPLAEKEYVEEALRLGIAGSSAVRLTGKIGNKLPVLDMAMLKTVYETVQWGILSHKVIAGHDVSDGGGFVTLVEMFLGSELPGLGCSLPEGMLKNRMVSELPGVILQIVDGAEKELEERLGDIPLFVITEDLSGNNNNGLRLNEQQWSKEELMGAWNAFSAEIEAGGHDESFALASFTSLDIKPVLFTDRRPRVVVLRETGTNGEYDMTLAFSLAGFDPIDVTVTDLIAGRFRLDQFDGLALPGGFSFGDIPRAGAGFAFVLTQHPDLKQQFDEFFANPKSFSLSVCNGCQVMMEMGYITRSRGIPEICPMQWNQSKKFESRFLNVKINDDDNIFFKGMKGAVLGIWVAHGEGYFDDSLQGLPCPLSYVDEEGNPTMTYPFNPNGSLGSRVALVSKNGRHLAIMPHPERTILPHQIPFDIYQEECFTRLKMFGNMRGNV